MIDDIDLPRARSRGLSLRAFQQSDLGFLQALYASTRADEVAQVDWMPAQRDHFLAMQFEAQHSHYMLHYAKAAFWVIELEGEGPIGRLYLDAWEDELRLIDIALVSEHRGRGLGTALLIDIMAVAAARGKAVRAHVEKTNPAQRLYARLGYRVAEDKAIYDLIEWHPDWGPTVGTQGAEADARMT